MIGAFYLTGEGKDKNLEEGIKWLRMPAEQGYMLAQATLSICYASGGGVEKNLLGAAVWQLKMGKEKK